jgi:16S rRNA (cytosine967-C5)-methyltransferase
MSNYRRPRRRHGPAETPAESKAKSADSARRDTARRASLPRRTAYDVLAAVHDRAAYANLLLPRLLAERDLTGRDAALATELAYGTLRGLGSYDAILEACSDRPLAKLDPPVLHVLRLGSHQILATRVGAYAAVTTSVDLAKSVAGPRVAGYVNAVLRRVATRDLTAWLAIVAPDPLTDPDGYLAIRHSHPRWIVAAYRQALGDAADSPFSGAGAEAPDDTASAPPVTELEAALAAGNARPRVTLATLPGGPSRDEVMPEDAEPGHWSPYAFTIAGGDPAALANSGLAAVQDEASQLAALALSRVDVAPQGSGLWLDMCAGPGGKARMLYGLATQAGARLLAADIHEHRAALVAEHLALASQVRLAPSEEGSAASPADHAVLTADGGQPPWQNATFDRVLVDVPCSGLGALRRRPEARWRKQEAEIQTLAKLQRDLLRSALSATRPGGAVAYVTCSPVPAETREVVTAVVSAMADVEILDAPAVLSDVAGVRSPSPLFAQLWPHRHGSDAIFIALLRRTAQ